MVEPDLAGISINNRPLGQARQKREGRHYTAVPVARLMPGRW